MVKVFDTTYFGTPSMWLANNSYPSWAKSEATPLTSSFPGSSYSFFRNLRGGVSLDLLIYELHDLRLNNRLKLCNAVERDDARNYSSRQRQSLASRRCLIRIES